MTTKIDPVGVPEIADLLGVKPGTVHQWRFRHEHTQFPEPDRHIAHTVPIWDRQTVLKWAKKTGRD